MHKKKIKGLECAHTYCYTVMDKVPTKHSAYALLGHYFSNGQVEGNADPHAIASPMH